ncbi:hypothetical protein NDU88_002690 [Pleurodeles waltl]|uniref:Secreted protein n=1 Tax=Pleurodeles waltl TaxID=8319 RepID=A0AAV7WQM0_PLEWA|nr:hypothetical protein NDU88_002690 [Pleurodeles waltl]
MRLPQRNGAVRATARTASLIVMTTGGATEPDAGDLKLIGTPDTERNDQEKPRAKTENPDGVKTAEGLRNQEPREDTLRIRHVPGGAWLTKRLYVLTRI